MGYKYQCSLTAQDCATLYSNRNGTGGPSKLAFTDRSCVRDARLEGNVGRCGFPEAPCMLQANAMDNCAGGGDSAYVEYKQVCVPDAPGSSTGTCRGKAGDQCTGNVECNWGMSCNNTYNQGIFTAGVCGGANAYMKNNEAADGLDFGRDYCLSGKAYQDPKTDYWLCSEGPPMSLTVAPSPIPSPTPSPQPTEGKSNIGVIIGAVAALLVLAVVLVRLCSLFQRRRRSRGGGKSIAVSVELRKRNIDVEEKAGESTHEDVPRTGTTGVGRGDVGPHAQDGADRPRRAASARKRGGAGRKHGRGRQDGKGDLNANDGVGAQHTMDGRGDGETEEEWLERMMRASNARMVALDETKRRLNERRRVEAQMDGSDGLARARS